MKVYLLNRVENIVAEGEIAHIQCVRFLLLLHCFQKLTASDLKVGKGFKLFRSHEGAVNNFWVVFTRRQYISSFTVTNDSLYCYKILKPFPHIQLSDAFTADDFWKREISHNEQLTSLPQCFKFYIIIIL